MTTQMRVGDFVIPWGESARWDDARQRLYFVDCAGQRLHWLDGGEPPLNTMPLPGMPAGVALTEGNKLVVCLDDGLYVVDPDAGTSELLSPYPDGMHGRANDANADGSGNLVTGTLNIRRSSPRRVTSLRGDPLAHSTRGDSAEADPAIGTAKAVGVDQEE